MRVDGILGGGKWKFVAMLELLANMGLFFMFCKENQKYRMESAFIKGRFSQISLPESRSFVSCRRDLGGLARAFTAKIRL